MWLYFVFLGVCCFFLLRNQLVCEWHIKASGVIFDYHKDLIDRHEYDTARYDYKSGLISYPKHVFSIWLWGYKSAFVSECREYLEKYLD